MARHCCFPWVLSVPRRAEDLLTVETFALAATLLANSLLNLQFPDPAITYPMKVFGVEESVNAFLAAWVAIQRVRGQRLRLRSLNPPTIIDTNATRDTFSSVPRYPPPSAQHRIYQASISHTESLIPFYTALFDSEPTPVTPTDAITKVQTAVHTDLIWICCTNGVLSAFDELGRVTPRTMTVRTVYVPPEYRQRGVAEAIVRAISRYYLGLDATDLASVPPGPPPEGVKDQIKLNVLNTSSEAVYRVWVSCFQTSLRTAPSSRGDRPGHGPSGMYRAILREVELEPDASARVRRGDGECSALLQSQ
ncbi:hypothetical protein LXA43DRAFT_714488 [Ganoderma leucocontextum]|nr:hypothetical protein LXA43DRAFT_714488 [Ganoderma leucocontextum]